MAHRKTLTQAQLDLLEWIAESCPEGVMEGESHRISAAALRRRGLVQISGRGRSWEAQITAAGREHLEAVKEPGAPAPRQANFSVTEELIREVIEAGGSLLIPSKEDRGGIDYYKRATAARRHGKVPMGKELHVRRLESGELEVCLEDVVPGLRIELSAVPVPERVARYHAVVRRFREDSERHEVSRAQMSRALRILQGLVLAAEERGYPVANVRSEPKTDRYHQTSWTGPTQGHIVISIGGFTQALRISEVGLPSRAKWERQLRYSRPSWLGESSRKPIGDYEAKASGRLCISFAESYGVGRGWADRKSRALEDRLGEVLAEIEIQAAAAEHRRKERERQAEERKRQWEAAMERARERHLEAHRAKVLAREVESWQGVEGIRAYCDAADARYPIDSEEGSAEWVAWARAYAERVDPLRVAPQMPADPETVRREDLKPFLEGWSPYGPDGWR
jgi:hypothetical protein